MSQEYWAQLSSFSLKTAMASTSGLPSTTILTQEIKRKYYNGSGKHTVGYYMLWLVILQAMFYYTELQKMEAILLHNLPRFGIKLQKNFKLSQL